MFGLPCQFRQDKFVILHPPLEGWLRRNVPDRKVRDLLFVYYSIDNLTYVVGQWTDRRRTHFYDVLNLGGHLTNFSAAQATNLRLMYSDPCTGERLAELATRDQDRRVRDQNDQEGLQAERLARMLDGKAKVSVGYRAIRKP